MKLSNKPEALTCLILLWVSANPKNNFLNNLFDSYIPIQFSHFVYAGIPVSIVLVLLVNPKSILGKRGIEGVRRIRNDFGRIVVLFSLVFVIALTFVYRENIFTVVGGIAIAFLLGETINNISARFFLYFNIFVAVVYFFYILITFNEPILSVRAPGWSGSQPKYPTHSILILLYASAAGWKVKNIDYWMAQISNLFLTKSIKLLVALPYLWFISKIRIRTLFGLLLMLSMFVYVRGFDSMQLSLYGRIQRMQEGQHNTFAVLADGQYLVFVILICVLFIALMSTGLISNRKFLHLTIFSVVLVFLFAENLAFQDVFSTGVIYYGLYLTIVSPILAPIRRKSLRHIGSRNLAR